MHGGGLRYWLLLMAALALLLPGCAWVTRASVDSAGLEANGASGRPSLSGDGRYVAFDAYADNLVGDDTNGDRDVFVHDNQLGVTIRASVAWSDAEDVNAFGADISDDGRFVVFDTEVGGPIEFYEDDIYLYDTLTDTTTLVHVSESGEPASGIDLYPAISGDGTHVAFTSSADDLVTDDTNLASDVFVRDMAAGATQLVSVSSGGVQANGVSRDPSVSANGRYVTFESDATNLVADDTNGHDDVFVRDTQLGITTRVSVDTGGGNADGASFNPSISADGRYVAFGSAATDLIVDDTEGQSDVFVRDMIAGTTERASENDAGEGSASHPTRQSSISGGGRYVAFSTDAALAPDAIGGSHVYVHDADTDTTRLVSRTLMQDPAGGQLPSISADGRYVAFESSDTDLVDDDTNELPDIFVKRTVQPTVTSISPTSAWPGETVTVTVDGTGFIPAMSAGIGNKVNVTSTTYISETQLEIEVWVKPDAALGTRTVTVMDLGTLGLATGSAGQCVDCFTVTSPPGLSIGGDYTGTLALGETITTSFDLTNTGGVELLAPFRFDLEYTSSEFRIAVDEASIATSDGSAALLGVDESTTVGTASWEIDAALAPNEALTISVDFDLTDDRGTLRTPRPFGVPVPIGVHPTATFYTPELFADPDWVITVLG